MFNLFQFSPINNNKLSGKAESKPALFVFKMDENLTKPKKQHTSQNNSEQWNINSRSTVNNITNQSFSYIFPAIMNSSPLKFASFILVLVSALIEDFILI